MLRCPHAVGLDLTEDRSKRRAITPVEEFVRKRGRDWEDEFVATLDGYLEPEFERGAYEAGAAQTEAFMRDGVLGVTQGVLREERGEEPLFLGIPDLLRREPGKSDFGDHHYVVGDIKSSGRPRSDQLLQVAFYSRMLHRLQGREPEYGYLILKDGREERFVLREFAAAIEDVEARVLRVAAEPSSTEPFFNPSCHKCHWSELCVPGMEAVSDLSLVQGMTRGLRTTLRRIEVSTVTDLAGLAVEPAARQTHLEPALLRRLKRAADARLQQRPMRQKRNRTAAEGAALVHWLYDAFTERMLYFGVYIPGPEGGEFHGVCPVTKEAERDAFIELLRKVPRQMKLQHYGESLLRWFTDTRPPEESVGIESRFVDIARRLRGAAIYPGPVFGLADHVSFALQRDPHRRGDADGAALYGTGEAGRDWLMAKGESDLRDLADLVAFLAAPADLDDADEQPEGLAGAGMSEDVNGSEVD